MDSELISFIRSEIKRQVQLVLFGASGDNSKTILEDIKEMIPGMPTIAQRPVMHPYGFVSRAPTDTISVVIRCGDHAGNRMVIGHRDANRPLSLQTGESMQYSSTNNLFKVGQKDITAVHNSSATYGIQSDGSFIASTPSGHLIFMNQTTGDLTVKSPTGHFVVMNGSGVTIGESTGSAIINLNNGIVQVTGTKVIVMGQEVTLNGGNINLGNNSFHTVISEMLVTYLDTHTHTSAAPGSPTSPPIIPSAVYNLNPAVSFQSLFVNIRSNIV